MALYPIKTPNIIKSIFNKWTWSIRTTKKEVYLTFDDGPISEVTPWVLHQLKKHNAKATFFCIGDNIRKHPETFKQIIDEGHQIGNHTFNHLKGWKTNLKEYIINTAKAQEYFPKDCVKLFRPPYGKITFRQSKTLRQLGYKIIMWDVLSGDFDTTITPKKCTQNVLKSTKRGSIIVFHDSIKAFDRLQETLPKILDELSNQGYQFKTL